MRSLTRSMAPQAVDSMIDEWAVMPEELFTSSTDVREGADFQEIYDAPTSELGFGFHSVYFDDEVAFDGNVADDMSLSAPEVDLATAELLAEFEQVDALNQADRLRLAREVRTMLCDDPTAISQVTAKVQLAFAKSVVEMDDADSLEHAREVFDVLYTFNKGASLDFLTTLATATGKARSKRLQRIRQRLS